MELFIIVVATVFVVALVMITWSQIDYNTKLIQLQATTCSTDPQNCDSQLYTKYHR